MAEYMGKLSEHQRGALAAMPREEAPATPDYFGPYRVVIDAMARAADEMSAESECNCVLGRDNLAMAQCHAAHALDQAITALEHAQIVLHV